MMDILEKKYIVKKLVLVCLENDTHSHKTTSGFCENNWLTYRYNSHTNHEVENRNNYRQQATMNMLTEHL